jgi:putative oxidoreductase
VNSIVKTVESFLAWFSRAASYLQSPLLLAIRLYWGWQFYDTGWGKLSHLSQAVENFGNMGAPAPAFTAPFIATLETVGGILLILGLASRLIAVPMTINMIMAYVIADREALGSVFSEPDKFYNATPFTFLMASVVVLAFGPGLFSLDALIKWYRGKQAATASTTAPVKEGA